MKNQKYGYPLSVAMLLTFVSSCGSETQANASKNKARDEDAGSIVIDPSDTENQEDLNSTSDEVKNDSVPSADDYIWTEAIVFSPTPQYPYSGNFHGSEYYKDIMTSTPPVERFSGQGWSTEAHESLHGLNSKMRNATTADDGFFYFQNGQGAYVTQPKKVMAQVRKQIGPKVRAASKGRYDLYLVSQASSWPEVLYLFDEWNAYVATSRTAYEMKMYGEWDNGNSDPIDGLADFLIFCAASLVTLAELDPAYLESNTQFKAAFAMLAEQSAEWIRKGLEVPIWTKSMAKEKIRLLTEDEETKKIRNQLNSLYGETWYQRVFKN